MALLLISFAAGTLTILAPCILPLLPAIVGGSAGSSSKWSPIRITLSLVVSVVGFALLLKTSASCASLPDVIWRIISGSILVLVGATIAWPKAWERLHFVAKLNAKANRLLGASGQKSGWLRDVLIGAALGPVFTTCSPTYFIIIGVILPKSIAEGALYLLAYALGLSAALLALAYIGRGAASAFAKADTRRVRMIVGLLVIGAGLLIFLGIEESFQKHLFHIGFFDITLFENQLLNWAGL